MDQEANQEGVKNLILMTQAHKDLLYIDGKIEGVNTIIKILTALVEDEQELPVIEILNKVYKEVYVPTLKQHDALQDTLHEDGTIDELFKSLNNPL